MLPAYLRFYYLRQQLVAIVQLRTFYERPLSKTLSLTITKTTEDDYFLSPSEAVCSQLANGQQQTVTTETAAKVTDFINQI